MRNAQRCFIVIEWMDSVLVEAPLVGSVPMMVEVLILARIGSMILNSLVMTLFSFVFRTAVARRTEDRGA